MNNHKIHADAIIFDKDGTLIDFDAFWVAVSKAALHDAMAQLGQEEALADEILEAIGVHNGITDIDSVLCMGTYGQIAEVAHRVLQAHGCEISMEQLTKCIVAAYNNDTSVGKIKATCPNLREVLTTLKAHHKKLAVITTDNPEVTAFCLKKLGVADLFDKVYTDDGVLPTKPCPDCALDFCSLNHLDKENVVMVGDTMTDVNFAHNVGMNVIGIAKSERNEAVLGHDADAIIHDLSELVDLVD